MTPPDWPAADRAYRQHHAACLSAERQAQAQTPSSAAQRGRSSGPSTTRRVIRRISLGCASARGGCQRIPNRPRIHHCPDIAGVACSRDRQL